MNGYRGIAKQTNIIGYDVCIVYVCMYVYIYLYVCILCMHMYAYVHVRMFIILLRVQPSPMLHYTVSRSHLPDWMLPCVLHVWLVPPNGFPALSIINTAGT